MELHVEALFRHDERGRLRTVNEAGGARAPLCFFGRTAGGNVWRVRHDVDARFSAEFETLCRAQAQRLRTEPDMEELEALLACVQRHAPIESVWAGPVFIVPHSTTQPPDTVSVTRDNVSVLTPFMEAWAEDVQAGVPVVAALDEGRAVSVCASVRVTAQAHEAGVETHPDDRRRGHAARAVRAWARAVRAFGCQPLYSTSWSNDASRILAAKLGLQQYGTTWHAG